MAAAIAWLCCVPVAAAADCVTVTSVPYKVRTPGAYCFTRSLSYAAGNGAAILVLADDVTLDFNGFSLVGTAGPGTFAMGVFADTRRGLTIKNGRICGFLYGVLLADDESQQWGAGGGHVLRDLRLSGNYFRGIRTEGRGVVIERCQVSDTGGTTAFDTAVFAFGIEVFGPGARVVSNTIARTQVADGGEAVGISVSGGKGILLAGNLISNETLSTSGASFGMWVGDGESDFVLDNRFAKLDYGIVCTSDAALFRDNVTSGVSTPYVGGTDGGNNN